MRLRSKVAVWLYKGSRWSGGSPCFLGGTTGSTQWQYQGNPRREVGRARAGKSSHPRYGVDGGRPCSAYLAASEGATCTVGVRTPTRGAIPLHSSGADTR